MNRSELVEVIAAQADISKASAARALDAVTGAVKNALQEGDQVALVGFGTFSVKQRAARILDFGAPFFISPIRQR